MRRCLIQIAIVFCLISTALSAPVTLTDDAGRIVTINDTPSRIVSLSPSNTEILFALGLQDEMAGVTSYCNYPPKVTQMVDNGDLEVIGGFKEPNLETIAQLEPDLVIASGTHLRSVVPGLEKSGWVVYVADPKNVSGVMKCINDIGKLTGHEDEASTLISDMENKIKDIENKVGGLERPKTFYVVWHDPLKTAGKGTFADELITLAGGTNIFHDVDSYAQVDLESVMERNPDVIITLCGMGSGGNGPYEWAINESLLEGINARLNGHIQQIDSDIAGRSGPRIVDALEIFAKAIHPEAFTA